MMVALAAVMVVLLWRSAALLAEVSRMHARAQMAELRRAETEWSARHQWAVRAEDEAEELRAAIELGAAVRALQGIEENRYG